MEKKITRTIYTVKLNVVIGDKDAIVAAALAHKVPELESKEVTLTDTVSLNEETAKNESLRKQAAEFLDIPVDSVLKVEFLGARAYLVSMPISEFIAHGTVSDPRKATAE